MVLDQTGRITEVTKVRDIIHEIATQKMGRPPSKTLNNRWTHKDIESTPRTHQAKRQTAKTLNG